MRVENGRSDPEWRDVALDDEGDRLLQHPEDHLEDLKSPSAPAEDTLTHRTPLWAWFLLLAVIFAVSSAGVFFLFMDDVSPITLAGWRLQSTSLILITGAAVQWQSLEPSKRRETISSAPLLAASGTALAIHFGTWVTSLRHTSLTHSLLFVSFTPVLLAVLTWCRGHLISKAELLGTGVGFVGTAVLASGAASEAEVKLLGDLAALTASCAFVPYLLIGRRLRSWMPLWVYAAPVTALAASELTLAAALLEGSRPFVPGRNGLFGWLASLHYLPFVAYLGIVPGIVGHTGINALLRHINPLVITLALNVEPVLGSVMGALVGVTSPPGVLSYAGGALIVVSTVVVSVGSARREEEERQRTAAAHEVKTIMMTPLDDL